MRTKHIPLYAVELCCASLAWAWSCQAMLVTPASPVDNTKCISEAIIKRELSIMDPENVPSAKKQAYLIRLDALKSLKTFDERAELKIAAMAPEEVIAEVPNTTRTTVVSMGLALPFVLTALFIWMTHRAGVLRDREKLAMQAGIPYLASRRAARPKHPDLPQLPESTKFVLREFMALCVHMVKDDMAPMSSDGRLKKVESETQSSSDRLKAVVDSLYEMGEDCLE